MSKRGWGACGRAVTAVVLVLGGLVAALGPGAPPAAAALPPVSAIGDSTLLGMTASARAVVGASYSFLWDARSCRRLVITSCRGRDHLVPPNTLVTMRARAGQLGDAVVIMAGYDDWFGFAAAVDAIMAEALRQSIGHVIWLTYRTQGPYVGVGGASAATYRQFNATLLAKARQYPELRVADWDRYTIGRSTWFARDGIHLSALGAQGLAGFLRAQYDSLGLQRCHGAVSGVPAGPPTVLAPRQAPAAHFTASAIRVFDTRPDGDAVSLPLGTNHAIAIPLLATGKVPAGTTSVLVNVTAVSACGPGYVTAYPCGSVPLASNVNFATGRTRAALASVLLDPRGNLCLFASETTDVVVDLFGSFGPAGLAVNPVTPTRFLDTRNGRGLGNPHLGHVGGRFALQVAGVGPVPAGVKAALLNVTVIDPDGPGYVTVYNCGAQPLVSNVNFPAGQVVANLVAAALDSAGHVCLALSTTSHVVVDVVGWFGSTGLRLQAATPQRIVDTRSGRGHAGPVPAGGAFAVPVAARALLATITAVVPTAPGYLTAYPCGARPNASTLNYKGGDVVPNLAAVASAGGSVCIYTSAASNVLVDQAGVFVP